MKNATLETETTKKKINEELVLIEKIKNEIKLSTPGNF